MSDPVSQELAALYRAESTLMSRARALRVAASEAETMGDQRRAAAMRGKARGLHEGARQIASVAAKIRALGNTADRKCVCSDHECLDPGAADCYFGTALANAHLTTEETPR